MTRDEAIAATIRCRAGDANRTPTQTKSMHINAARRIDSYVALGMLKLDEPKSERGEFLSAIASRISASAAATAEDILARHGFKIVSK